MGWSFVQSTSSNTSSASSLSLAYSGNVTVGNLLVVAAFVHGGATSVTVSDTAGNTWTQAVASAKNATDGSFLALWFAVAKSTGATTVTMTPSTGIPGQALAISEFSPGSPATSYTIALDGTNSAIYTTATTAPSAGSIPVSGSGELVVAAVGEGGTAYSGTLSAGTGFTLDQTILVIPVIGTEYDLSANSALVGAFTASQARTWDVAGASFSASSAASVGALLRNIVSRPRFEPAYFE